MRVDEFKFEVIVTADRGYYLKYKDADLLPEKVGKPIRMIFSKTGIIPEMEEVALIETPEVQEVNDNKKVEDKPVEKKVAEKKPAEKKATTKKTTKKTTSK